jgi:hypothetical protein
MLNDILTSWFRWYGGRPCFQIYGKQRSEKDWRVVDVFANAARNMGGRWPLWRGTCITWTSHVIAVGRDFAESVLREQRDRPASREIPVEVSGGRIRDLTRRGNAGGASFATASEVLAHECGHTRQAACLGALYLPVVGAVTLFREGPHFWNHFENDASEHGQFGGIVAGSVGDELISALTK